MSNEEKAREIGLTIGKGAVNIIIATAGALQMADWKDQMFKEYLEKKKKELKFKVVYGSGGYYTKQIGIIDEIINELLK